MTTLKIGMYNNSEVRSLQTLLKNAGYYSGAIDGDFGPGTESAVKAYQSSKGLSQDGIVGTNTWNALNSSSSSSSSSSSGSSVSGPISNIRPDNSNTWNLSNWTAYSNGTWQNTPTLTVNGKNYQFSTPQEYITALQQLQGEGMTGNISQFINEFNNVTQYFKPATQTQQPTQQQTTTTQPTQQASQSVSWSGNLQAGSTGASVTQLQQFLKNNGFLTGNVDGIFGSQTTQAVKSFQQAYGLTADGIAGANTMAKMNSVSTGTPTQSQPNTNTQANTQTSNNTQTGQTSTQSSTPTKILKTGSSGADVLQLQKDLNTWADAMNKKYGTTVFAKVAEDGIFGSQTSNALGNFQNNAGVTLVNDQIYGANTAAALQSVLQTMKPTTQASTTAPTNIPAGTTVAVTPAGTTATNASGTRTLSPGGSTDFDESTGTYKSTGTSTPPTSTATTLPQANVPAGQTVSVAPTAQSAQSNTLGSRVLKSGVKGDDVKELQQTLNDFWKANPQYNGYSNNLVVDGDFGAMTQHSLQSMQQILGLKVDGIFGQESNTALTKIKAGEALTSPTYGTLKATTPMQTSSTPVNVPAGTTVPWTNPATNTGTPVNVPAGTTVPVNTNPTTGLPTTNPVNNGQVPVNIPGGVTVPTTTNPSTGLPNVQTGTGGQVTITTPTGTSTVTSDLWNILTQGNANAQSQLQQLDPAYQAMFGQVVSALEKAIEAGKTVNPAATITPAKTAEFLAQATADLDPYYQEQFSQIKNDLNTSVTRLMEDYNKTVERTREPFNQDLKDQANTEADAGTAYSSGRNKRELKLVDTYNQGLSDLATSAGRNVEDLGRNVEQKLGSEVARGLNLPQLGTFTGANTGIISQTGTRSLYSPKGDATLGTLGEERKKNIRTEAANREQRYLAGSTLTTLS